MESAQLQTWRGMANARDGNATYEVGECYYYGKHGVKMDEQKAVAWYRKAAELGDARALFSLGHCYENGVGVPEDHRQAFSWYRKASTAGSPYATKAVGDCYDRGVGVDEDEDTALQWYRKAADMGSPEAMTSIGFYYFKGRSVPVDYAQSMAWFNRAAGLNDSEATYKLGLMHEHGNGTPVNLTLALSLCKRALSLGKDSKRAITRLESAIAALPAQSSPAGPRPPAPVAAPSPSAATSPNKPATPAPAPIAAATSPNKPATPAAAQIAAATTAPVSRPDQATASATTSTSAPALVSSSSATRVPSSTPGPASSTPVTPVLPNPTVTSGHSQKSSTSAARAAVQARRAGTEHAVVCAELAQAWAPTAAKLLDCPVCLKSIPRNASVLLSACLHGLCRTCAANLIETAVPFPCPVCQVLAAPMDHPPHPLIEAELARHDRHDCTKCANEGDTIPAVASCAVCECLLCDDHMRVHRKSTKLSAHELTPLAPAGAAPLCPTHDLPFEAYCASDACHTVICAKCLTSTHPMDAHRTRLLDEAVVTATRARLTAASTTARASVSAMVEHAADAAMCARDIRGRNEALVAEVNRAIDVLVATLEMRRAALCAEVEERGRTERAALMALQESDEYSWRLATSAAEIAEQVAAQPIPVLFTLEPAATARTTAVVAAAAASADAVVSVASLRLDLGDADRYLSGLGRIVIMDEGAKDEQRA